MNAVSRTQPGRKRRRLIAGALVAGLVALGIWLSNLIPGLGLGTGGGGGIGTGNTLSPNDSKTKTPEETRPVQKPAKQPDVVEVRIDGNRFLLKRITDGRVTYDPVQLDEIVQRARKAPGDDHGVKVRIATRAMANLDLEDKLKAALRQAGLKTSEIDNLRLFQ